MPLDVSEKLLQICRGLSISALLTTTAAVVRSFVITIVISSRSNDACPLVRERRGLTVACYRMTLVLVRPPATAPPATAPSPATAERPTATHQGGIHHAHDTHHAPWVEWHRSRCETHATPAPATRSPCLHAGHVGPLCCDLDRTAVHLRVVQPNRIGHSLGLKELDVGKPGATVDEGLPSARAKDSTDRQPELVAVRTLWGCQTYQSRW